MEGKGLVGWGGQGKKTKMRTKRLVGRGGQRWPGWSEEKIKIN